MTRRLASLVAQITPGQKAVRLLPAGEFRSADGSGRPSDAPAWRIDAKQAAILIARDASRASRRVVDYEHQTVLASQNGKPAPAAGWIEALEWREAPDTNPGLYAMIGWTDAAAAMIAAGEYRYISPVFPYDKTGRVLDILHAGLTNNPGLDGLTDLVALSSHFPDMEKKPMMDLLKALGLAETASEAEALAAVAKLTADADARIAALTAQAAAAPDPAQYAPVATVLELQGQVATLTAQIEAAEVAELLAAGRADGRILPSLETWASGLNKVALKGFLDHAQPIAALNGTQTGGKAPDAVDAALCATPTGFSADPAGIDLFNRAKAHAKANNLSFDAAVAALTAQGA